MRGCWLKGAAPRPARCDPASARHADLETRGRAEMPIKPDAAPLAPVHMIRSSSRGKRIFPDGANIAAIAPVSSRLYRKSPQLAGGGFLLRANSREKRVWCTGGGEVRAWVSWPLLIRQSSITARCLGSASLPLQPARPDSCGVRRHHGYNSRERAWIFA
jgi:hypothetical protein